MRVCNPDTNVFLKGISRINTILPIVFYEQHIKDNEYIRKLQFALVVVSKEDRVLASYGLSGVCLASAVNLYSSVLLNIHCTTIRNIFRIINRILFHPLFDQTTIGVLVNGRYRFFFSKELLSLVI